MTSLLTSAVVHSLLILCDLQSHSDDVWLQYRSPRPARAGNTTPNPHKHTCTHFMSPTYFSINLKIHSHFLCFRKKTCYVHGFSCTTNTHAHTDAHTCHHPRQLLGGLLFKDVLSWLEVTVGIWAAVTQPVEVFLSPADLFESRLTKRLHPFWWLMNGINIDLVLKLCCGLVVQLRLNFLIRSF